jgi:hypothetical protein
VELFTLKPFAKDNLNRRIPKENFEPARKLLLEKNLPFDPEVLAQRDWQSKLSPFLSLIPDLNMTLRTGKKIKGVQIADTLILPEDVELMGDTLLLANTIVYEGSKTRIHGLGTNIYVFPIASTGHLSSTFEEAMRIQGVEANSPEIGVPTTQKFTFDLVEESSTVLEIDVSGQGMQKWLAKKRVH